MTSDNRVISGQEAPFPIPWQVSLQNPQFTMYDYNRKLHWCGGTILDRKTILTAAHCFDNDFSDGISYDFTTFKVRAGTIDKYNGGQIVDFSEVILWPEYSISTNRYADIAIIKTKQPLTFGPDVQPACLPSGPLGLLPGQDCWTSGWGQYQNSKSKYIQKVAIF